MWLTPLMIGEIRKVWWSTIINEWYLQLNCSAPDCCIINEWYLQPLSRVLSIVFRWSTIINEWYLQH